MRGVPVCEHLPRPGLAQQRVYQGLGGVQTPLPGQPAETQTVTSREVDVVIVLF